MKEKAIILFGILCSIFWFVVAILGLWYLFSYFPISLIVLMIILFLSLFFADTSLWKKYYEQVKDKSHTYLIGLICLAVVSTFIYSQIQHKKHRFNINSKYCDSEFNFKGYIYAFPDDTKSKNYRLVADFSRIEDLYIDAEDREHVSHYITLNKMYFYNGGYIEFEDCNEVNKVGELFSCTATNDDKDWYFRFYGEMVKNNAF